MTQFEIEGTPYFCGELVKSRLAQLDCRIREIKAGGGFSPDSLFRTRKYSRIKSIYHLNAIGGSSLRLDETRQAVAGSAVVKGKPLRDQLEARNLAAALEHLEELADTAGRPIGEREIREIHQLALGGVHPEAGLYRASAAGKWAENNPPAPEAVPAAMKVFGGWLRQVSPPAGVRPCHPVEAAAVAHIWLIAIHPFTEGNGRVAQLLMNLLLMRGGYPVPIIPKGDKRRYRNVLERSGENNATPFVALLGDYVEESVDEFEAAATARDRRARKDWAASIAAGVIKRERAGVGGGYVIWRQAMALLKSYFRQTAQLFDEAFSRFGHVKFKDFPYIDHEKYAALRSGEPASRTWFFSLEFAQYGTPARYLFFFWHASRAMGPHAEVTLHLAREEPPGSFKYDRVEIMRGAADTPDLFEIGYDISQERLIARKRGDVMETCSADQLTKRFFMEVVENHFTALPKPREPGAAPGPMVAAGSRQRNLQRLHLRNNSGK